jgi:hypothetical protein
LKVPQVLLLLLLLQPTCWHPGPALTPTAAAAAADGCLLATQWMLPDQRLLL